jgi:2-(1,2-epoxy-1,2-dihydrophenyl)acetyl-CoA isomerase
MYETLNYSVENGVGVICLNRPDAANAMNPLMGKEINLVSLDISENPDVRAVVLTATGRMFCAGGDLSVFASAGLGARRLMMEMAADLHLGLSRLARNRAPVIGAVNGTAAGAGFSLVMACDLVLASEDAVFTMAYTKGGLSPDGSSTYFMPRRIGDRRTRELMLTNRVLSADEALDWGIVNRVVGKDELMAQTMALAKNIQSGPSLAFGKVKELLDSSFSQSLETQMELEARAISEMVVTDDGQEGIHAFLEKRKPEFKGR